MVELLEMLLGSFHRGFSTKVDISPLFKRNYMILCWCHSSCKFKSLEASLVKEQFYSYYTSFLK